MSQSDPGAGIIAFVIFVFILGAAAYLPGKWECENIGSTSNVPSKYVWPFGGCFVKVDGHWVPLRTWRNVPE